MTATTQNQKAESKGIEKLREWQFVNLIRNSQSIATVPEAKIFQMLQWRKTTHSSRQLRRMRLQFDER